MSMKKIKLSDVSTPKDGCICYCDRYWSVTENEEILMYKGFSPQCNREKRIAEHVCNKIHAKKYNATVRFIPVVFLPVSLYEF